MSIDTSFSLKKSLEILRKCPEIRILILLNLVISL